MLEFKKLNFKLSIGALRGGRLVYNQILVQNLQIVMRQIARVQVEETRVSHFAVDLHECDRLAEIAFVGHINRLIGQ